MLKGGNLLRAYLDVKLTASPSEKGMRRRLQLLDHILDFAKHNIDYYKNKPVYSLDTFPVIDKSIILADKQAFLTPINKIPGQKGPLHIQKTSGSTGTPFCTPQDTLCRLRRVATIKYENDLIGFRSCDPLIHVRSGSHYWSGFADRYDSKSNIFYFDNSRLDENRIKKFIETIDKRRINFIRAYMTSIDLITRYAVDNKVHFNSHPFFISVGELMPETLRRRVTSELGCHIISQYGNEENGVLGSSIIDGVGSHIRLNRCSCLIEILKEDCNCPTSEGEAGRVVITDLSNHAMPLIRYDTGDIAIAGERDEAGFAISLSSLMGRRNDLIRDMDGNVIDLFNGMPECIYNNEDVKQYQFIQKNKSIYNLILNMASKKYINEQAIIHELKSVLGEEAVINIEYTEEIPVLSSGKRKIVINEYHP